MSDKKAPKETTEDRVTHGIVFGIIVLCWIGYLFAVGKYIVAHAQ